jgi:sigma-B regulation protein RsbU (phosphoserine phosphatase)
MKTRVPLMARLPISISAPLVVGIPVLVVGVWLSVMWNRQSHEAVRVLADQNIQQIHEMAATKVADVLSMPVRVCELNQHLIVSGSLPASDLPRWRSTLLEQGQSV